MSTPVLEELTSTRRGFLAGAGALAVGFSFLWLPALVMRGIIARDAVWSQDTRAETRRRRRFAWMGAAKRSLLVFHGYRSEDERASRVRIAAAAAALFGPAATDLRSQL